VSSAYIGDDAAPVTQSSTDACEPDSTVDEPLIGPEAQARSADQIEVWALIFFPMPPGEPIRMPVNTEIKIVWRVTGTGAFSIAAIGPAGRNIAPDLGPDIHDGSNWKRPGDEWGTVWTFPEPGCWSFQIQRGDSTAQLTVDITA
jgi:hypothetical protein